MTYEGALHYVMCRGIKGKDIFLVNRNKITLLDLLNENSPKFKIRIFGYCITDNDYHVIIENTSGKMSDFFKQVNSQYGMFYRIRSGTKGNVFCDRYKSTLIQEESYLKMAIAHIILIPVQEGTVEKFDEYLWSSASEYFIKKKSDIVDNHFVNELFGSKRLFRRYLQSRIGKELPILKTKYGPVLGEKPFLKEAIEKNERRKKINETERVRSENRHFESIEKITQEFEKINHVKIEKIDVHSLKGKRLRGELLVHLKERAGLTYPEIIKIPLFSNLQYNSLGGLYRHAKKHPQGDLS